MGSQHMLEMCFQADGQFCAKYFIVSVFSYGKNVTAIGPGLGIRGDGAHDRPNRHRYVDLAEQLLLLAILYDPRDLVQVAQFQRNDLFVDLVGAHRGGFLVHDIVEREIIKDPVHIEFYQVVDLVPGTQGLVLVQLFQYAIGIFGTEDDQRFQQFLFGAKIIRDHGQVDPGTLRDIPDRSPIKTPLSKELLRRHQDMFSLISHVYFELLHKIKQTFELNKRLIDYFIVNPTQKRPPPPIFGGGDSDGLR